GDRTAVVGRLGADAGPDATFLRARSVGRVPVCSESEQRHRRDLSRERDDWSARGHGRNDQGRDADDDCVSIDPPGRTTATSPEWLPRPASRGRSLALLLIHLGSAKTKIAFAFWAILFSGVRSAGDVRGPPPPPAHA